MSDHVQDILNELNLDYDASTLSQELRWELVLWKMRDLQIKILDKAHEIYGK
jgi:hypothetical protein